MAEIMVPRTDINLLEADQTIEEVMPMIQEWGHSRIPVYRDTPDDILGILYVKDLISHLHSGKAGDPISDLLRKALFVPETMKVPDMFGIMKRDRIHMAVVVDEYDKEEPEVVKVGDDTWKIQGCSCLDDLSEILGCEFLCDDVETVAGYVLELFGDFPKKGDRLTAYPWAIEVTDVEDHRINEVLFTRIKSMSPDVDEESEELDDALSHEEDGSL